MRDSLKTWYLRMHCIECSEYSIALTMQIHSDDKHLIISQEILIMVFILITSSLNIRKIFKIPCIFRK